MTSVRLATPADLPAIREVVGAAYARYAREASDYRLRQAVLDDR